MRLHSAPLDGEIRLAQSCEIPQLVMRTSFPIAVDLNARSDRTAVPAFAAVERGSIPGKTADGVQ